MRTYIEVVNALPAPTELQTREFAEFVTGAHSWYKHLSAFEASEFVFYLDPNAGRAMVHTASGDTAFVDHDESTKFHYTWQPTARYRERFGYWTYDAPYGRSILYPTDAGMADTTGPGLCVQSPEGEWVDVSEPLVRAGTAQVSSLMYYANWFGPTDHRTQMEHEVRLYSLLKGGPPLPLGTGLSTKHLSDMDNRLSALPAQVGAALGPLTTLWMGEAYHREMTEVRREVDALYKKAFATPGPADPVLQAGGIDALRAQSEVDWEKTASRRRELELIPPLIAALDRERERQIEGMVAAMQRFLEVVRPPPRRSTSPFPHR